jgi:hypothetical protein
VTSIDLVAGWRLRRGERVLVLAIAHGQHRLAGRLEQE